MPKVLAAYRGSFDILDNGNRVALFDISYSPEASVYTPLPFMGHLNTPLKLNASESAIYLEVDTEKNVIWEALGTSSKTNGAFVDYRVSRLPLYKILDNYIKLGVRASNLIPKEMMNMKHLEAACDDASLAG